MMMLENIKQGDAVSLETLDIGMCFRDAELASGVLVLLDYKQPAEYIDGVWAVGDAETGDFVGLAADSREVTFHGEHL